jgi:hypothetical protein
MFVYAFIKPIVCMRLNNKIIIIIIIIIITIIFKEQTIRGQDIC